MGDQAHVLYRFYSATGQLLYVGITMNPPQRFKSHRDTKEWWDMVSGITVESYSSRDELAAAERRAIKVEHPLHNIVHAKPKHRREPEPPPPPPPPAPPGPELDKLFASPAPVDVFSSIFKDFKFFPPNRYGVTTKEEYEARVAAGRAKEQAILDCTLCIGGYRNGYLCNHVDYSRSRLAEAQRKVQKESLQVIQGGGA